ncbi:MAG: formate--tetrahydrofolate ligase [candidate division WOR-3 bacterium]|nr:MAG: formate--tetrahydrofolate ligase [candidate division WOR-3 bacterium]
MKRVQALGFDKLPVCIAKTPLSLSDDPACVGACSNFKVTIGAVNISAGAGFLVPIAGDMMLMPGLARRPDNRPVLTPARLPLSAVLFPLAWPPGLSTARSVPPSP